tara:strand:- start:14858 stop:15163 length:306 start_codon:yes stop_codon:yes gene_type:complete
MRASGRTFRSLLEAIQRASEGYDVYYVCANERLVWLTSKEVGDIIRQRCVKTSPVSFEFGSGGKLTLISKCHWESRSLEVSENRTPPPLTIFDHYQGGYCE